MNEYNCQECGICCMMPGFPKKYVRLQDREIEMFSEEHIIFDKEGKGYLKVKHDDFYNNMSRCVFLVGNHIEGFLCEIYEDRPMICRNFSIDGERCNNLRKELKSIGIQK